MGRFVDKSLRGLTLKTQEFTTSGTFTPSDALLSGLGLVEVFLIGGGGAGNGLPTSTTSAGASSFGSFLTANGGSGGYNRNTYYNTNVTATPPPAAGVPTPSRVLNYITGAGNTPTNAYISWAPSYSQLFVGSAGAKSPFGAGGGGYVTTNVSSYGNGADAPPTHYGAGGGGGYGISGNLYYIGTGGSSGAWVYAKLFINEPVAVTIGAGGITTSSNSLGIGGNGAPGYCLVKWYE